MLSLLVALLALLALPAHARDLEAVPDEGMTAEYTRGIRVVTQVLPRSTTTTTGCRIDRELARAYLVCGLSIANTAPAPVDFDPLALVARVHRPDRSQATLHAITADWIDQKYERQAALERMKLQRETEEQAELATTVADAAVVQAMGEARAAELEARLEAGLARQADRTLRRETLSTGEVVSGEAWFELPHHDIVFAELEVPLGDEAHVHRAGDVGAFGRRCDLSPRGPTPVRLGWVDIRPYGPGTKVGRPLHFLTPKPVVAATGNVLAPFAGDEVVCDLDPGWTFPMPGEAVRAPVYPYGTHVPVDTPPARPACTDAQLATGWTDRVGGWRSGLDVGDPLPLPTYTLVWAAPPDRGTWPAATDAICHLEAGATVRVTALAKHRDGAHGRVWWAQVAR